VLWTEPPAATVRAALRHRRTTAITAQISRIQCVAR